MHKVHQHKLSSNNFKSTTTFENKSAAWRGAHSYSRWAATAQSQIYPRPCLFPQYVLTSALHSLTLTCEQALLPVLWAQRQESSSKSTTGAARSCGLLGLSSGSDSHARRSKHSIQKECDNWGRSSYLGHCFVCFVTVSCAFKRPDNLGSKCHVVRKQTWSGGGGPGGHKGSDWSHVLSRNDVTLPKS